jgi:hypothetical protein
VANEFVIRIRADDAATATVNKIKAALGKVTEPIEKSQKSMGRLGDVGQVGLDKLKKGLGGVAGAARKVVDRIVEIIPGLTAIGGAASLAGLSALAERFGSFGFGLNKTSKLLGMNAQDLAAWHVAAKRAGVSAEEFDSSMSSSQMAIRGAAYGADPHAMLMLQKMGVQIKRNNDGSIDYLTTQQRIMDALRRQPSVEGQRDAANSLGMGGLLPMIQNGTWDADKARAYKKGLVPTPDEIARAKTFWENVNDLKDSVSGLGNSIGSSLIPVLDPLVKSLSVWLDAHRVQIAEKLSDAVGKFVNWVASINWDGVTSKVTEFWDAIGGVQGVLIAVAAITLAGPLTGVLNLVSALARLTTAAIPEAVTGVAGLSVAGVGAMAALAVGAAFAIGKIKDSTEGGHFVGRNAGAPNQKGLRQEDTNAAWWAREVKAAKDFFSFSGGHFVSRGSTDAHGSTSGLAPLGIRNNNPLNMLDHDNEITYATPEQGIAAAAANLRKGYRGLTLAAIADKWTGGARTGNTPQQMANYVGLLSKGTGLSADQTPDLNSPAVVAALLKAQIRAENGQQPYTDAQINAGVGAAIGGGTGGGATAGVPTATNDGDRGTRLAALQSSAPQVNVTVHNALPGTTVEAKTPDGGYLPTKVNYALRGADGAAP